MSFKDYKKASRGNWGTSDAGLSIEQIKLGAILRIADATEKMAEPFSKLVEDREWFKKRYEERGEKIDHLERRIRSLKGAITKLKK